MSQPPQQPPHGGYQGPGQGPGAPQGQGPQFGGPQGDAPQFGAQQGPGQPFGAPGQPGGYGGQQGPGFTGFEDEKPKKKGLSPKNIITIVLAVAALGFLGWRFLGDMALNDALQVGNCVTASGKADDVDLKKADCDSDGSEGVVFQVITVHEGSATCADPMVQYTESSERRGKSKTKRTVCLGEVMQADKCYEQTNEVTFYRSVDCADSNAQFKVTKILDDASASCAEGEHAEVYSEWPRTYCIGQP